MPRQPIYFDEGVLSRLKKHTKEKYGGRRALSIVVQCAVVDYLDKEEMQSGKKKSTARPKTF